MRKQLIVLIVAVLIIVGGVFFNKTGKDDAPAVNNLALFVEPINNATERITKKPFGIFVSPNNSPVSPERFTGYHTGVDFETFTSEQNSDVVVYAICDGSLIEAKMATGYGGVAIQKCELDNQPITVVYGHIKLSSVSAKSGQQLKAGDKLAILGDGYSAETNGERKHLHIGIHKGNFVVLLGYVQESNQLIDWINLQDYLK